MKVSYIDYKKIKAFMKEGFIKAGVPKEDAEISAEVLITSDLRGIDSHGVGRFKMYIDRIKDGIQLPVTNWKIIKETPTTLLVDGGNGMGHVVSYHVMELIIEKAKKYGMGSAAITNSTHFGIDGYYPLMAVKEDMVGFAFTNARPSIAPTFGVEPMIGTNPISMAAPTDEDCPFCIDGATSISQRGKIEQLEREEKETPEGWAIDENGKPYTNTSKLLIDLVKRKAALLPLGGAGEILGGHKGYGLAVMVEILSSAFAGGPFGKSLLGYDEKGNKIPYGLGHFFMVINIENFIPVDVFKRTTGEIVRTLRNSKKAPGHNRIYVAGEKECDKIRERKEKGIPINENLKKILNGLKADLGISVELGI